MGRRWGGRRARPSAGFAPGSSGGCPPGARPRRVFATFCPCGWTVLKAFAGRLLARSSIRSAPRGSTPQGSRRGRRQKSAGSAFHLSSSSLILWGSRRTGSKFLRGRGTAVARNIHHRRPRAGAAGTGSQRPNGTPVGTNELSRLLRFARRFAMHDAGTIDRAEQEREERNRSRAARPHRTKQRTLGLEKISLPNRPLFTQCSLFFMRSTPQSPRA